MDNTTEDTKLTTCFDPSSFSISNSNGKVVFVIDKDGCHVPEDVSVEESAAAVIRTFNSYIKSIVKPLEKENIELKELKALIYNGIRVKVSPTETKLYDEIHVWYGEGANGTLILDKKEE